MKLSIEQTEIVISALITERNYYSSPEHEEVYAEVNILVKKYKTSLRLKKQWERDLEDHNLDPTVEKASNVFCIKKG